MFAVSWSPARFIAPIEAFPLTGNPNLRDTQFPVRPPETPPLRINPYR